MNKPALSDLSSGKYNPAKHNSKTITILLSFWNLHINLYN